MACDECATSAPAPWSTRPFNVIWLPVCAWVRGRFLILVFSAKPIRFETRFQPGLSLFFWSPVYRSVRGTGGSEPMVRIDLQTPTAPDYLACGSGPVIRRQHAFLNAGFGGCLWDVDLRQTCQGLPGFLPVRLRRIRMIWVPALTPLLPWTTRSTSR